MSYQRALFYLAQLSDSPRPRTARQDCVQTIYCASDGVLRIALEYEPGSRLPCPLCNRSCAAGFLFCRGFTRKELPFHELVDGPLTANHTLPAADEPRPPKPPAPLAENEQLAIDALRRGSAAGVVSETYQIPAHRLYYLRKNSGPCATQRAAVGARSGLTPLVGALLAAGGVPRLFSLGWSARGCPERIRVQYIHFCRRLADVAGARLGSVRSDGAGR
jgi:hypothetical protein